MIQFLYAFDLSLTATGWASLTPMDHVMFGTLPTAKITDLERLQFVRAQIEHMLTRYPNSEPLVFLEGFAFGRAQRAHEIGGLGYIIRDMLQRNGIPYVLVAPTAVKKFAAGKGNVNKEIVIREVYKRWGYSVDDNNAADALALLYLGMALTGRWQPTTDAQRAVMAEVRKSHPWLERAQ